MANAALENVAEATAKKQPGVWTPNALGLPSDCPVDVVGIQGDYLCLVDAAGQFTKVKNQDLSFLFLQRLFLDKGDYLRWAWPRFDRDGNVAGVNTIAAIDTLYRAAGRKGLVFPEAIVHPPSPPRTCAEAAALTAAQFKVGDVVRLRSGGHWMTVISVGCGGLGVAWSDDGEIRDDDIVPAALEIVSADELRANAYGRLADLDVPF